VAFDSSFRPVARVATMTAQHQARFWSSSVLRLFPTWLWKAELRPEVYEPINNRILQSFGEIQVAFSDLKPGESWQSEQTLHELEAFRPLVACIDEAARSVLDHLKVGHKGFAITGCWATVNAPNAGHRVHSHPNNYLSGVYYVQTQEGADTIDFHDPRPQIGILCPPVTELTAENTDQVVVKVHDGTMLIFPAWLPHSVDPNRSDRLRVSISFNIMLSSYAETISKPMWKGGWRRPLRPR
jgi:uncharacterized protein (TIGR02466 family)